MCASRCGHYSAACIMGPRTPLLLLVALALGTAALPAAPLAPSVFIQPPVAPYPEKHANDVKADIRKHSEQETPLKSTEQSHKSEDDVISADSDIEVDIKREKVDLNNPGKPQRQEHDSQSPDGPTEEQQTVTNLKQTIADTQIVFKQGLQGVSQGFQNWFPNNDQLAAIQQSIQNFQHNFENQISKLNATIQGFWKPDEGQSSSEGGSASPAANPGGSTNENTDAILDNVEKGVETIANKFEYGVKSIVNGVQEIAQTKADNSSSATGTNNPFASLAQYMQQFQNNIVQNFNNLTSTIQNYINQNQQNSNTNNTVSGPSGFFQNIGQGIQNIIGQQNGAGGSTDSGAQSDESTSPSRPTIWQGFQSSIQNIWNRPGSNSSSTGENAGTNIGNGPIVNAIQNNPIILGIQGFIQPKPQSTTSASPTSTQTGNKVEQEAQAEQEPSAAEEESAHDAAVEETPGVPEAAPAPAPAPPPAPAPGPLAQIVQHSPLVQGLAGAMQRIQHTISKPDRPRDHDKDVKAGWWPRPPYVNHSPAQVTAWSNFVDGLIGTIGGVITGTTTAISTSVNSAINTLGTNIQAIITTAAAG